jgi:hypothetical protein
MSGMTSARQKWQRSSCLDKTGVRQNFLLVKSQLDSL